MSAGTTTTMRMKLPDGRVVGMDSVEYHDFVRAEVAAAPPLSHEQKAKLAILLRPAALELRRRRTAATAKRRAVRPAGGWRGMTENERPARKPPRPTPTSARRYRTWSNECSRIPIEATRAPSISWCSTKSQPHSSPGSVIVALVTHEACASRQAGDGRSSWSGIGGTGRARRPGRRCRAQPPAAPACPAASGRRRC